MLADYTPTNSVLDALVAWERSRQQRQYDMSTNSLATEATQWRDWINKLKGWLPVLNAWANDAVIGAQTRTVIGLVQGEITRATTAYNATVALINAEAGKVVTYGGVSLGINTRSF